MLELAENNRRFAMKINKGWLARYFEIALIISGLSLSISMAIDGFKLL